MNLLSRSLMFSLSAKTERIKVKFLQFSTAFSSFLSKLKKKWFHLEWIAEYHKPQLNFEFTCLSSKFAFNASSFLRNFVPHFYLTKNLEISTYTNSLS
ncbi:hypothetical protein FGO68_gene5512 [Halteria grandinella]|uniref:Uncharacterized protein n=1 Tax=Halteria grandinella TaxID=5974 RepID=A0A8J8NPZ7_HALGN|nr:hypothetical protein FGO68_gene5512 [Halteria grandinella]